MIPLVRNPMPIQKVNGGYKVDLGAERTIAHDLIAFRKDPDFMRNAAIAAITTVIGLGLLAKAKGNPKALFYIAESAKKTDALSQFLGLAGPTLLATGTLGMANKDSNKTDNAALAILGLLGTLAAGKGFNAAPNELKAMAVSGALTSAGLMHSARIAEKLENRNNTLTSVLPVSRYLASHEVLDMFEKKKGPK